MPRMTASILRCSLSREKRRSLNAVTSRITSMAAVTFPATSRSGKVSRRYQCVFPSSIRTTSRLTGASCAIDSSQAQVPQTAVPSTDQGQTQPSSAAGEPASRVR